MLFALAVAVSTAASSGLPPMPTEAPAASAALRGVHLSGWGAGSPRVRERFLADAKAGGFNAVAVALKDFDGWVFVKGVPLAEKTRAFANAIPDLPGLVRELKSDGFYAIARIAVFKDDHLARARPDLAVHTPDGSIWTNDKGTAWVDPYREEVGDYVVEIASRAAAAGFDEIQFDYIRFPSDGKTKLCRYSRKEHTLESESAALRGFLAKARARLPSSVKLSLCTFGLTTSVDTGMGIGQRLAELAELVDYVSPMMYPSHYARGEYRLRNPDGQPYFTIKRGVADALERLGPHAAKLRPYLQDFSLGSRYAAPQVRAQIRAAEEQGVSGWLLWNAQNRYDWGSAKAGPIALPTRKTRKETK